MRPFDTPKPPDRVLVTSGGVQIVVRAPSSRPPPPERQPPPPPPPLFPRRSSCRRACPGSSLDKVITELCELHRAFVLRVLVSHGDILPASANDLAQNVIVALWKYVRDHDRLPDTVRGFLVDLVDNEVIDHNRMKRRRPALDREADAEAVLDDGPDPEEAVAEAERLKKVHRCIALLPHEEAEAIRYVNLLEETLARAASALKRPLSTVAAQQARGLEKLKALANAEEEPPPPPAGAPGRRRRG